MEERSSWTEPQLLSGDRRTHSYQVQFSPQKKQEIWLLLGFGFGFCGFFLPKMDQCLNVGNFVFICSDQEMFGI